MEFSNTELLTILKTRLDKKTPISKYSTDELLEEIKRRKKGNQMHYSQENKLEYIAEIESYKNPFYDVEKISLSDKIKIDFFFENIEKIAQEELEKIVKIETY